MSENEKPPTPVAVKSEDIQNSVAPVHSDQHASGHLADEQSPHPSRQHPHHLRRSPSSGHRQLITGALVLLALTALLAAGIVPRMQQNKRLDAVALSSKSIDMDVNLVSPLFEPMDTNLTLPGSVQSISEATINARSSGYLKQLYVDIGSRVKAGQLLATIESPEIDQQLTQAVAETAKSRAGSQQARADVSRMQANVAQAQADSVKAESNVEASKADVAHANAKLLEAEGAASEAEARIVQSEKRVNGRRADLARTNARLDLAKKTYVRWKELARGGAVSGQDLDEAQANYEQMLSAVTAAEADLESSQADLTAAHAALTARKGDVEAARADIKSYADKTQAAIAALMASKANITAMRASVRAGSANVNATEANVDASNANRNRYETLHSFERIVAPFDGVITARNVDIGTLVSAGSITAPTDPTSTVPHSGLFGIARTDILRIQVNVPQPIVSAIKNGQKALVLFKEFPGRVFEGVVARSSGALDASSRTVLCEVHLKNPDNLIVPGMFTRVVFMVHHDAPLVRVPANTLLIDGKGIRVASFTSEQTVHFKTVVIGRDFGKEMEIASGLDGTEKLIADPTDSLLEGSHVHAIKAN